MRGPVIPDVGVRHARRAGNQMNPDSADDLQTGTRKPPTVRWVAAALCILYGFAKLNGSQFTVLDSEVTKPLGQVSGFWLTWYYFGYSPIYGSLIALIQSGCSP